MRVGRPPQLGENRSVFNMAKQREKINENYMLNPHFKFELLM